MLVTGMCRNRTTGRRPVTSRLLQLVAVTLLILAGTSGQTNRVALPWSCDFDSNNICQFEQLSNNGDQFDWTIGYGWTPSGKLHRGDSQRTGPQGGQQGSSNYIYIEASGPGRGGEIARLLTPALNFFGGNTVCLDFYYHMLGARVGILSVYVHPPGQILDNIQPAWEQDRDMGDIWFRVVQTLNIHNGGRIEFRGKIGGTRNDGLSWSSDLAFDTIKISPGSCTGAPPSTNDVTLPFACDFESSLCGMKTERRNGEHKWIRISGPSPSTNVGPKQAFSGNYYLYAETSEPAQSHDLFILTTLPIRYDGYACLSFAYHMNGNSGSRFIITTSNRQVYFFDKSGYQNQTWMHTSIDIYIGDYYMLEFLVLRGNSIRGDVAIDNIRMDPYACPARQRSTTFPPTVFPPVQSLPWQCGFERDVCGMQQSDLDRFDWTRARQTTATINTGPNGGRSGEYYIYTEASDPRLYGDTALVLTPMLNAQGYVCLEFYYHMFGSGMGSLQVYNSRLGPSFLKFQRDGPQENRWLYEKIDVDNFNYGDTITFAASRGNSYTSDIALDDIKVQPGRCSGTPPVTPAPPTSAPTQRPGEPSDRFSCNSEAGQTNDYNCYLRQDVYSDQIDWIQQSGKTPSGALYSRRVNGRLLPVTGPNDAREGSYYLYIEASGRPRDLIARMYLEGDDMIGSDACLNFYYSMNGYHTGTLRIVTRDHSRNRFTKWELNGNQGFDWASAAVDINRDDISELTIEATTRGEFSGDIAIDSVRLVNGLCESIPSAYVFVCNFETNSGSSTLCGMQQERSDRFDWSLGRGPTPSQYTGPDRAASGVYYMFIEASKPRVRGDFAILLTPELRWNGDLCVEFSYNMYGFHIGTLEVFMENQLRSEWSKSGEMGTAWVTARVQLPNFRSGNKVGFKAIRGNQYSGDIAIDSIRIRRGGC